MDMAQRHPAVLWVFLAVYVLDLFGIGVIIGSLTSPSGPAPPPEISVQSVGDEP